MSKYCTITPKKGVNTFNKLKKLFGRNTAAIVFNNILSKRFKDFYKDSFVLDNEGIPTYESIINNPSILNYIGMDNIIQALNKNQESLPNTVENTKYLIHKAALFNNSQNSFILFVTYDKEQNLVITTAPRTKDFLDTAKYLGKLQILNEFVADSLKEAGVTLEFLNSVETAAGRVGLVNFKHAKDIANNFAGLIGIANNMEGFKAESEEFSHLLVRLYKNNPLIERSLKFLSNYNNAIKLFSKEEVDFLTSYYNNNMDLVAEELLGRLLQLKLLNNIDALKKIDTAPLIKRAFNQIISFFKGLNPFKFRDTVEDIENYVNNFSKKVINKLVKVKPKKIVKILDLVHFNSLTEKAKQLYDALNKAVKLLYKKASMDLNLQDVDNDAITIKQKDYEMINRIKSILSKNFKTGESMKAISEVLNLLLSDLTYNINILNSLDNYSTKDRAIILQNAITRSLASEIILKEIRQVLTEEFLSDEDINSLAYVYSDTTPLTNETDTLEETVDTSGMTIEQIIAKILEDSKEFKKTDDNNNYEKSGLTFERITKILGYDSSSIEEEFTKDNPWYTPSTNIGTGIDELVRAFFDGLIKKGKDGYYVTDGTNDYNVEDVYPNINKRYAKSFIELLEKFKKQLDKQGITIIPKDVTVSGNVGIIDMTGTTHNIRVAGTLDLLGVDKNGNWHIFDMKTIRNNEKNGNKIRGEKLRKYRKLLTLYKTMLEKKYGIKVASLNIIPITVNYPSPTNPNKLVTYKKSALQKHTMYNGEENNLLLLDNKVFKAANPNLQKVMKVAPEDVSISYNRYTGGELAGLSEGKVAILNIIGELTKDLLIFKDILLKKAKEHTIDLAEKFVGEEVEDIDLEGKVIKKSVKDVLYKSVGDISLLSKLLLTHSRMGNITLLVFNSIIRLLKAKKRLKVIEVTLRILALGKKYEELGVNSYEWMYSDDKANYIVHTELEDGTVIDYDYSAYKNALLEAFKEIESKYSAVEATLKKIDWVKNNTLIVTINGAKRYLPKSGKFPSRYDQLSDVQKGFYNEWMSLKLELDSLLPEGKTNLFNTIKIRKNGMERFKNIVKLKGAKDIVNALKDTYLKSYDDEVPELTVVQRDFLGKEKMELPIRYIGHSLDKDYSDISLDAIGTLIAYADMACEYEAMEEIVDSLEIAKYSLSQEHVITDPSKKELFRTKEGKLIESDVFLDTTNSQFLDAFLKMLETKVYGRINNDHEAKEGKVDVNKVSNFLLKIGSYTQLGFNLMANTANLLTGIATVNIEMSAGRYFNRKDLAKADKKFIAELGDYVADIGQRIPKSKLALYMELLNIRLDFSSKKRNQDFLTKTLLGLIFGPHLLFIGQEAGDIWLYSRVALAMGEHLNLSYKGESINVYDALEKVPIDKNNEEAGYKLVIKEGVVKDNGEAFTMEDLMKHSTAITNVNQRLYGNYNEEDLIEARKHILGRFLMQYRDFLPTAIMMRFLTRRGSVEEGNLYEGMYVSMAKLFKGMYDDLKAGEFNLTSAYNKLQPDLKENIKRVMMELSLFLCVVALGTILKSSGSDKRKKSWFRKYMEYMLTRERTELGAMIPGPNVTELFTIMNSPIANTKTVLSIWNLTNLLWVPDYFEEIDQGKFKGHSEAYRTFIKSPLSLWYKNIDRIIDPSEAEKFYNRN